MEKVKFRENSYGFFAEYDLQNMRATYRDKNVTPSACCLYAQQAIEKLLKHMRKEQGCKPGHPDLTGHHLLRLAEHAGYPESEKSRQEFLSLSKLYFEGRYPNESEYYLFIMPSWQEVGKAVKLAENVYAWVCSKVENQGQELSNNIKSMKLD